MATCYRRTFEGVGVSMGRRGRLSLTHFTRYFVTTTIHRFRPVFTIPECCDALIANIRYYREKHEFRVFGFVIMPTHFHWLLEVVPEKATLSDVMRDIKKYAAWDILDILEQRGRRDLLRSFTLQSGRIVTQHRHLWMKRFDDKYIRDELMFASTLRYIHNNPVKAGLVRKPEDYKYSSARNYTLGDHSVLDVSTEWYTSQCYRGTVAPPDVCPCSQCHRGTMAPPELGEPLSETVAQETLGIAGPRHSNPGSPS
ncbi:MAG: transposase [Ignavibacterium sp.]